MSKGAETQLARMDERLKNIEADVADIKKKIDKMDKKYVTNDKFGWFEKVFWLGMGLLITTVGGRILDLI